LRRSLSRTDSGYSDYSAAATIMRTGGCQGTELIYGCTINDALNYDSTATILAGCRMPIGGCTDSAYVCYRASANVDDGSCTACGQAGCTNPSSQCYSSVALVDDGSCNNANCISLPGCTDSTANNYANDANTDDGSCTYTIVGCGDARASNFDSLVTAPSVALCVYAIVGCTDSNGANYASVATAEATPSSCQFSGCVNSVASNYNPSATFSPGFGACTYEVAGCTDPEAFNYLSAAVNDDGTCQFYGCMYSNNPSFNSKATQPPPGAENGGCMITFLGCLNSYAANYESSANVDDGSCFLLGCTNPLAPNYQSWALIDNGLCEVGALGCTNSRAFNYEPLATADNGQCIVIGCLDSLSLNFDPEATVSGVLCELARPGCTASIGDNFDVSYNVDDGSCVVLGCTNSQKVNYFPEANQDLLPTLPGSCREPRLGCIDQRATNYNSSSNWDDGSCIIAPPAAPPSPPTGSPDFLHLELITSYSPDQLDLVDLQASVAAFQATVPTTQPDFTGGVRRLQQLPSGGDAQPPRATATMLPPRTTDGGRRLQSGGAVREDVSTWVANSDWRLEYPRRIAALYWLPSAAVTLAAAVPEGTGTRMDFNILTDYLPAGATPAGLKSYATATAANVYSIVLAVPVTSVAAILDSELQLLGYSPPAIASPAPPPVNINQNLVTIPAGVYIAVIIPVVAVIVGLGVFGYWYKKRRDKRVPMATVQPQQGGGASVGGQLLVQPPDLPD